MPEIAEVARIVHFLRLHLVGKNIRKAIAPDDPVLFGKAGTTGAAFETAATGKRVVSAGSQGKYFWLVFDRPPHVVMHFGMTGWIHIRGEQTAYPNYYKKMKSGEADQWPPKFWKFQLETEGSPSVQVAFTDPRRFGRVRLVDCPGDEIRQQSPLVDNGPDPVVDAAKFTEYFLKSKMQSRHVPIKALLLDQAAISGIGNWVADEVLYQSSLYPGQYCDEFSEEEMARLHRQILHVCQTAVDSLGDSDQFPEQWLFKHRWGKGTQGGKGGISKLPNGERLAFITVGGRTSCYAPGVQKRTGKAVAGAQEEPIVGASLTKPPPSRRISVKMELDDEQGVEYKPPAKRRKGAPASSNLAASQPVEDKQLAKRVRRNGAGTRDEGEATKQPTMAKELREAPIGRRRSARLGGKRGHSSPFF